MISCHLSLVHPWLTLGGLRCKTLFEGSNPPPAAMRDTNTLQQLQNRIAKMEQRHVEELRKLKVDHDQLEAHVKRSKGDEHSAHTLPERTQGETHPRRTVNTLDDLSLSHLGKSIQQ